jgi:hypothetical protein
VFCAPIPDAKARVARKAGLRKSRSLRSLRISGPDKAGIGAAISGAVGSSGVNLRGFSGAAIGRRAVFYIAFDSQGDADRARRAIRRRLR